MTAIKLTNRKPAKPKLVPTTKPQARADLAPAHHFFASSAGTWRVGYDVATLIDALKREGLPFNVWMVPGSKDADYRIEWFAPQVEGATWLAFYGKGEA